MDRIPTTQYNQGYLAALQTVLDTINHIQLDLKLHRRKNNAKTYAAIVECIIKNRWAFKDYAGAFVRCNDAVDGGFEVYIEDLGVYNPETRRIKGEQ